MEVLQKPGTKSATTSRSSIVLETSVVAKLEKLAYVQGTSAAVAFQRMVEQVLGLPSVATCFHEYIQEYWWGYAPVEVTALTMVRVGEETLSLLLYLSNTTGFAQKTDQTAEILVSFFAQQKDRCRSHRLPDNANEHLTSTAPPSQGATDMVNFLSNLT